jgi:hypothetical protein
MAGGGNQPRSGPLLERWHLIVQGIVAGNGYDHLGVNEWQEGQ